MKAYCTRVGAGPFPTELFDETGKTSVTLVMSMVLLLVVSVVAVGLT